ncbi:hypothetical protein ABIA23_005435 [Sinorhizobium fredii]
MPRTAWWTERLVKVALGTVGAYLNQIGLPDSAVVYVTSAPPEGIDWLSADDASEVGINYELFQSQATPEVTATGKDPPYDPMGTTAAFYSALAAADGESPCALVVPEKRGRGPFNEASIRSFFGAMSVPLMLTDTTLRGRDEVRVSYEYVTDRGRRCRGRADVETVYTLGKTLISRIMTLDGC